MPTLTITPPQRQRKPPWIRVKAPTSEAYHATQGGLRWRWGAAGALESLAESSAS